MSNLLELYNENEGNLGEYKAEFLERCKVEKFLLNIIVFVFDTLFEITALKRSQGSFA